MLSNKHLATLEQIDEQTKEWEKRNQIEINKLSNAMEKFICSENKKIKAISEASKTVNNILTYIYA